MGKRGEIRNVCQSCGKNHPKWQGQCSGCGEWNTLVEERVLPAGRNSASFVSGSANLALCQPLDAIQSERVSRLATGLDAFDELVGGGLVPGGITLIGGEPGVGKSTFILQLSSRLAVQIKPIIYVSGEESATQIKLRADRLQIGNAKDIVLVSEQNLESALGGVLSYLPRLLVIDSIQTVFTPQFDSSPGSIGQVRECAAILTKFGKDRGLPVIIIGHVTKDGSIAGPKVLEHLVDTVLYFEGEVSSNYRILRVFKNRFGPTGEVGIFQMTQGGLLPVLNPSDLFVSRIRTESPGVAILPLFEGTRCILAEVQALVTHSFLAMPRRVVAGMDSNRLHLILAVLEKHGSMKFYDKDVFVNIAGGLRLTEPGGDLGLSMALVGSSKDKAVAKDILFIGELTLSGEVRPVSGSQRRIAEGRRFGFKRFMVSSQDDVSDTQDIIRVRSLKEALDLAFPRGISTREKGEDQKI